MGFSWLFDSLVFQILEFHWLWISCQILYDAFKADSPSSCTIAIQKKVCESKPYFIIITIVKFFILGFMLLAYPISSWREMCK